MYVSMHVSMYVNVSVRVHTICMYSVLQEVIKNEFDNNAHYG